MPHHSAIFVSALTFLENKPIPNPICDVYSVRAQLSHNFLMEIIIKPNLMNNFNGMSTRIGLFYA